MQISAETLRKIADEVERGECFVRNLLGFREGAGSFILTGDAGAVRLDRPDRDGRTNADEN